MLADKHAIMAPVRSRTEVCRLCCTRIIYGNARVLLTGLLFAIAYAVGIGGFYYAGLAVGDNWAWAIFVIYFPLVGTLFVGLVHLHCGTPENRSNFVARAWATVEPTLLITLAVLGLAAATYALGCALVGLLYLIGVAAARWVTGGWCGKDGCRDDRYDDYAALGLGVMAVMAVIGMLLCLAIPSIVSYCHGLYKDEEATIDSKREDAPAELPLTAA
jgi:hypothetical protein